MSKATDRLQMAWLKYTPPTDESNKAQIQAAINVCGDAIHRAQFAISYAKDPAKIEAAEHDIPLFNAEQSRLYALPVFDIKPQPVSHPRPVPPVVEPRNRPTLADLTAYRSKGCIRVGPVLAAALKKAGHVPLTPEEAERIGLDDGPALDFPAQVAATCPLATRRIFEVEDMHSATARQLLREADPEQEIKNAACIYCNRVMTVARLSALLRGERPVEEELDGKPVRDDQECPLCAAPAGARDAGDGWTYPPIDKSDA